MSKSKAYKKAYREIRKIRRKTFRKKHKYVINLIIVICLLVSVIFLDIRSNNINRKIEWNILIYAYFFMLFFSAVWPKGYKAYNKFIWVTCITTTAKFIWKLISLPARNMKQDKRIAMELTKKRKIAKQQGFQIEPSQDMIDRLTTYKS